MRARKVHLVAMPIIYEGLNWAQSMQQNAGNEGRMADSLLVLRIVCNFPLVDRTEENKRKRIWSLTGPQRANFFDVTRLS